jgi:hypothetical protein
VVWTFDETDPRHVKRTSEPPADWTRYEYADPGFDRPFAWGFVACGPNGEKIIYDEIYERHMLVPDLARRIKLRRTQHGYAEPRFAVIDPAADQKSHWGRATMSIRAELAACGIRTIAADNSPGSVDAGFERIRSQFSAGYLAIQEHCRWHRFELLNHRFKESARPGGDVGGEKYEDKDNHLLAGLRYGLGTGMVYIPFPEGAPPRGTAAADLIDLERQRAAETRRDRRRSGRTMR